jgi:alkylhydroperoxidase family enzyme
VTPAQPPYDPPTAEVLDRMMPGTDPIRLFRVFARNVPMAAAMTGWGRYELGRQLSLSLREREIVIDRTCARTGCEYEWGVHVLVFARRAGLDAAQLRSLAHGSADDPCWTAAREHLLIRAVDALCATRDLDEQIWAALRGAFDDAELVDLVMLCGWYQAIGTFARAMRLDNEPGAPTFASVA